VLAYPHLAQSQTAHQSSKQRQDKGR